jgi:hypothetical protein
MSAIGPFKICNWSDSSFFFFKKTPDDDPRIETRVGVHFTIKTTKKWFYVCIIWCKINWIVTFLLPFFPFNNGVYPTSVAELKRNENKEDSVLNHFYPFEMPTTSVVKLHFNNILTCFHRLPNEVSQKVSLNNILYLCFAHSFYSLLNLTTLTIQPKLYKLVTLPIRVIRQTHAHYVGL